MAKYLSEDLRIRVIRAIEAGMSRNAAARRFGVSIASAVRWINEYLRTDRMAPKPRGGDRRSDANSGSSQAPGFSRRVVFALVRFADFDIYGSEAPFSREAGPAQKDDFDFILGGALSSPENRLQVHALLTETRTGRHVWSGVFETAATSSEPCGASQDLAERVARAVGQPYGPILLSQEREAADRPEFKANSADCVIRFYRYLRSFDRLLHAEALKLEKAVQNSAREAA